MMDPLNDGMPDTLQDLKDMLMHTAAALLGIALIALLDGLPAICALIICAVGLPQANYAYERHKVVKSGSSPSHIPKKGVMYAF